MKRSKKKDSSEGLEVIESRAAGVDIGSRENWVCCPQREPGVPNLRRFGTTTREIQALADWLHQEGVQTLALESTGTYWIPLYDVLEERGMEVLLVNARQLRKVPGRKTDMLDCQWIQKLHSCGLLRGCFRPSNGTRQLRELSRESSNLKQECERVVQRMQKALDSMNIKIHQAASDLTGVTGMSILRAIVAGERDPRKLAQLRDRRCKKSVQEIAEYLKGTWISEHLFNLKMLLGHYEHLQGMLEDYQREILQQLHALSPPRARATVGAHYRRMSRRKGMSIAPSHLGPDSCTAKTCSTRLSRVPG